MKGLKGWVWGLIGSGATAVLALGASAIFGVFDKGLEAQNTEAIATVVEAMVLDEADIKRILTESHKTATGETYGQILISTKEEVIILKTKVDTMERALAALTE